MPPPVPAIPEVSMTAASSVPDRPVAEPSVGDTEFSLKVTSRLVDVGLVAYDKKGRPVTDLKPGEIELYDNGNKQEIRSFSLAAGPPAAAAETAAQDRDQPAPAPPAEEKSFANRAPEAAAGASAPAVSEVGSGADPEAGAPPSQCSVFSQGRTGSPGR